MCGTCPNVWQKVCVCGGIHAVGCGMEVLLLLVWEGVPSISPCHVHDYEGGRRRHGSMAHAKVPMLHAVGKWQEMMGNAMI